MAGSIQGSCLSSAVATGMCLAGFLLLLGLTFPVAQIALGVVYMRECPVAPLIPVYVTASGIWALTMVASLALRRVLCPASPSHKVWTAWIIILTLFFFVWTLFGSYHIYSIYPPNHERNTTSSSSSSSIYRPPAANSSASSSQTSGNLNPTLTSREQTPEEAPYCSRTVYLFAFWTTTLVYVAAGLVLVTLLCLWGFMEAIDTFVKYITF